MSLEITLILVSTTITMLMQLMAECRKSKCTTIDLPGIHIERDIEIEKE